MPEIDRAAPGTKRWAIAVLAVGAVLGALVLGSEDRWGAALKAWLTADPARLSERMRLVLLFMAIVIGLPLLLLAIYLWRLGAATIQAQRFPPAGVRLVRDTEVVRGERAVARGRLFCGLSIVALLGLVLLSLALWRLAAAFTAGSISAPLTSSIVKETAWRSGPGLIHFNRWLVQAEIA